MRNVVLARIDDRLIHGQVVTGWLKLTNGNKIYIVDDKLKNDAMMQTILKTAAPVGTKVFVQSQAECAAALKKEGQPNERIVILAKTPQVFEYLIDEGAAFPQIILGGMGMTGNRQRFYKNIAASEEEIECMRRIVAKGTEIIYQLVPDEASKNIKTLL